MSPARMKIVALVSLPLFIAATAGAQQITNPVYRVAKNDAKNDTVAQQPATPPVAQVAQASAPLPARPVTTPVVDPAVTPASGQQPSGLEGSPFDLVQKPGEHPLMPCLRLAKQRLAEMDKTIGGYSAVITKTERINGATEPQQMAIKVRHEPFSVHMKFIQPFAGREVLYNASRNSGKLVALDSGWKRRFGKVKLDPNGTLAMRGQRYPITMMGIRNLTTELIKIAEADVKYGECSVRYSTKYKIDGRPTTMIEATHPVPRKNFRFNIARIFLDHEYKLPVAYSAYSWPTTQGGKPVLEEQYIYTNLQLNPGLTDADFDETNPNLFVK